MLHTIGIRERSQVLLPETQRLESIIGSREIRLSFVNNASDGLKNAALRVDHIPDAMVHRKAAQIFPPGHANAFEIAAQRSSVTVAGLFDGDRRAPIRTGDRG